MKYNTQTLILFTLTLRQRSIVGEKKVAQERMGHGKTA